MKKALFWEKRRDSDKVVQCLVCPRKCLIKEGLTGFCKARKNIDGTLYSIAYGKVANGLAIDPIEKKPLYHFLPNSTALSFGTAGCNLRCKACQNFEISQRSPDDNDMINIEIAPEEIVEHALKEGCESIAYTYTEPTVFYEFVYDTAKFARKRGLRNVVVSNGFINQDPLVQWCNYIDAANIDLKGNDDFYRRMTDSWLKPVQDALVTYQKKKVWLEVTTLVIPGENDDTKQLNELMSWFGSNLGYNVPWHFTGFYPCYKLIDKKPTSETSLLKIREKAVNRGFNYVYAGNVMNVKGNTTYCPKCKEAVIRRLHFSIVENLLKKSKCPKGHEVDGVFE